MVIVYARVRYNGKWKAASIVVGFFVFGSMALFFYLFLFLGFLGMRFSLYI